MLLACRHSATVAVDVFQRGGRHLLLDALGLGFRVWRAQVHGRVIGVVQQDTFDGARAILLEQFLYEFGKFRDRTVLGKLPAFVGFIKGCQIERHQCLQTADDEAIHALVFAHIRHRQAAGCRHPFPDHIIGRPIKRRIEDLGRIALAGVGDCRKVESRQIGGHVGPGGGGIGDLSGQVAGNSLIMIGLGCERLAGLQMRAAHTAVLQGGYENAVLIHETEVCLDRVFTRPFDFDDGTPDDAARLIDLDRTEVNRDIGRSSIVGREMGEQADETVQSRIRRNRIQLMHEIGVALAARRGQIDLEMAVPEALNLLQQLEIGSVFQLEAPGDPVDIVRTDDLGRRARRDRDIRNCGTCRAPCTSDDIERPIRFVQPFSRLDLDMAGLGRHDGCDFERLARR